MPGLLTPKINTKKTHQFKKGRASHVAKDNKIDAPEIIKGEQPAAIPDNLGSSLEAMVYRALLAAGWKADQIEVQTPVLGGRNPRGGGQIVDFVLYTPYAVPIRVHGDWWHRNKDEDYEKDVKLAEYFAKHPVIIWGHECSRDGGNTYDFDQTRATIIRKVGRA